MSRENDLGQIYDGLALLMRRVEVRSAVGMTDLNVVSENFFRDLLNLSYGWQLRNANEERTNEAAIDLHDEQSRVSVQVTAEKSAKKIHETIAKFKDGKLNERYDRLIIMVMKEGKFRAKFDKVDGTEVTTQNPFDLARHVQNLTNEQVREVRKYIVENVVPQRESDAEAEQLKTVDLARFFIETKKPKTAEQILSKVRNDNWDRLGSKVKYRLLTNLGMASLILGRQIEAAKLFGEALSHNPRDEKARTNAAAGLHLAGDLERAVMIVQTLIAENPLNVNAHSILIQCSREVEEAEQRRLEVPAGLQGEPHILFGLSSVYDQSDKIEEAYRLANDALSVEQEPDMDSLGRVAQLRFRLLTSRPDIAASGRVPPELVQPMLEVIALYTRAIAEVIDTELRDARLWLFINRGVARSLIGLDGEARQDFDLAVSREPCNAEFRKISTRYLMATEAGRDEALKALEAFSDPAVDIGGSFMFAHALLLTGRDQRAIEILDKIATVATDPAHVCEARLLAAEALFNASHDESALAKINELGDGANERAAKAIVTSSVALRRNDQNKSAEILRSTVERDDISLVREPILDRLALRTSRARLYDLTVALLQPICHDNPHHPSASHLLESLFHDGNRAEALRFGKRMVEAQTGGYFSVEIVLAVLGETGDLLQARDVCVRFLTACPSETSARLRLATIDNRLGNLSQVDQFLDEYPNVEIFTTEDGVRYARLLTLRNRHEGALDSLYRLCKRRPRISAPFKAYISTFLFRDDDKKYDVGIVGVDAWVSCDIDGSSDSFVIVRVGELLTEGERDVEDGLVKRILGRTEGDVVTLRQTSLSTSTCRIVELKSKFVRLFQEILQKFPAWFPDEDGIEKIRLTKEEEGSDIHSIVEKMLEMRKGEEKRREQILDLYRKHQLTIGSVASLVSLSGYEGMEYLIGAGEPVRCSLGRLGEVQLAVRRFIAGRRFVLDATSIFTIGVLNLRELVQQELEGRLLIGQATLDEMDDIAGERKRQSRKERMTIWKKDETVYRHVAVVEALQRDADHVSALAAWARTYCQVTARRSVLERSKESVRQLDDLLSREFADSLFIADEEDAVLWTEDETLRQLAVHEVKVGGVWTKAFLDYLRLSEKIAEDEYAERIIQLMELGFSFIEIDAKLMLHAVKKNTWRVTAGFERVASRLAGTNSEAVGAANVVTDFFKAVFLESIEPMAEANLVAHVLTAFSDGRNRNDAARLIRSMIEQKFALIPLAQERFTALMEHWEQSRGPVI